MGAAATDLDFEPFHSEFTTAPSGISLREQVKWADEQVKWTDFRDDARRQGPDLAHCPGWQLPGEVFVWFKSLMLSRRPRRWWGNCQAAGPAPGGGPSFERDRRRFDALATFYGNRYRGSVVINYLLGALAVLFALAPAALPHFTGPPLDVLHLLELSCIVLMVGIYWRGRSPGHHGRGQIPVDRGRARNRNRRWHQRWLEYRGLAECFRYAELLYPLEAEVVKGPGRRDPREVLENGGWAQRYFEWRFEEAQRPPPDAGADEVQRYVARLRQMMLEQRIYHEGNAEECETITRRLHVLSGLCFVGTLLGALAIWWHHAHWLLLLAAGLPALAASIHGILATGEYIKLGESSTATAGAIDRLIRDVDARLAEDQGRGGPVKSLVPLVPEVRAFWNLVTSEVTGWQATLWDKNVPLP